MTTGVATQSAGSRSAASRRALRSARERADQIASWPAVLAWGSGLVVVALGAGALTGGDLTPPVARLLGVPLALVGLALIGWGTVSLSRGAVPAPRSTIVGCLAGIILLATALATDPVGTSIGAVAAASVLLLALAMVIALRLRRPPRNTRTGVLGIVVAAVVVTALAAPAITGASYSRLTQGNAGVPVVIEGHH